LNLAVPVSRRVLELLFGYARSQCVVSGIQVVAADGTCCRTCSLTVTRTFETPHLRDTSIQYGRHSGAGHKSSEDRRGIFTTCFRPVVGWV